MSLSNAIKRMRNDVDREEVDYEGLMRNHVGPIVAFTDGSCLNNGRRDAKGGYAVVFPDHPEVNSAWPIDDGVTVTNNRAEYYAWLAACGLADKMDEVSDAAPDARRLRRSLVVHSDSELLVKTVNTWLPAWSKNGFVKRDGAPVANGDLVRRIHTQLGRRSIKTVHVKAHTDGTDLASEMNRLADKLARDAAVTQKAL
jgi:ribonuclease HI